MAARRIACAGSLKAEEEVLRKAKAKEPGFVITESVYAVIGSAAHRLAELCLEKDTVLEAEDWVGEQLFVPMQDGLDEPIEFDNDQVETWEDVCDKGYLVTVDNEMAHHVQSFVEYVNDIRNHSDCQYFATETRYSLDRWLPGNHGTADAVAVVGKDLFVIDFKYGKGVKVEAKDNVQAKLYALAVLDRFEPLFDIKTVVGVIHQPRIDNISSCAYFVDDLFAWADDVLVPAYQASVSDNPARTPGSHCRFCTAQPICGEVKDHLQTMIQEGFPILDGKEQATQSEDGKVYVPLDIAALAKDWANAVEAYAVKLLESGVDVSDGTQGYKLVHGRSRRDWADEDIEHVLESAGIEPFVKKIKSPAQVEKELGKKTFSSQLATHVVKKPGKPTLAPESDKRPAISSADALGFEDETAGGSQ